MKKVHWTQRPEAKKKLEEAHRKAARTRINRRIANEKIAANDEATLDTLVEREFECKHCGASFSTQKFATRHEKNFCYKNPKSKESLNNSRSKVDELAKRITRIVALTELAHGEILAVDNVRNMVIVSIPIESPLQEIGVGEDE